MVYRRLKIWQVSKPFKEIPYSVSSNEKYPIARLGFTQEDEANAQLIASAPDLYEALKLSRLHCAGGTKIISIIDKALAKAEDK